MKVLINGKNPLDQAKRTEALQFLQDQATTRELEKIVELAKGPMRSLLTSM